MEIQTGLVAYISGLASHDDELLSTLHQESCKLVAKNFFDFISLLDLDGNANGVNTRLNETSLILCS